MNALVGLKPAIAVSLVWTLTEILILLKSRSKPTTLFIVSSSVAIIFGTLDLFLSGPFFLKIEAAVINAIFSILFGLSLLRKRSVIQEIAEQKHPGLMEEDPKDRRFFFGILTFIWCVYYLARAVAFTWLNFTTDFSSSLYIRTGLGMVSFWILLGASIFLSGPAWRLLVRFGWMPSKRVPSVV